MKQTYSLVGLSKPNHATLELLDSDKETFNVKIDMEKDRINALWGYCKNNWEEKKIAIIECDNICKNGRPINGKLVDIEITNQ